ncbi:MAG: biopolymer transporter ExbD [Planctomyces sp.]|nr:biopolymer transporter ExbD [Planctomyces sp.]
MSQPSHVSPDLTPMIDVTFQLITFFMVVTNFEQTQADERIKLPEDVLAKPVKVARREELVINLGFLRNRDGSKQDSEPWVFLIGEQLRLQDFGPRLQHEARVMRVRGDEQRVRDTTITIRADADVPAGVVQQAMQLSQEAGFEKFALKAKQAAEDG